VLELVQGRVERALTRLKNIGRLCAEALGNAKTMKGLQGHHAQDESLERALHEI
jgi:hypothetical protein